MCACVFYSMYLAFWISYTSSVNCIWFPIVSYVHYSNTSSIGTSLSNKLLYMAKLLRGSFCTSIWKMFIACILVLPNDKGIVCNNIFAINWKIMKTIKVSPWKFCHTYLVQSLKVNFITHVHVRMYYNMLIYLASQQDKENSDKRKKRQKSTISLNQLKYLISYCIRLLLLLLL